MCSFRGTWWVVWVVALHAKGHSLQQCHPNESHSTTITETKMANQGVISDPPPCLDANHSLYLNVCPPDDGYFVTDPQPWNMCSLPKGTISSSVNLTTLWLQFKRMVPYGPFVSTALGDSYGTPIPYTNISIVDDALRKNCLVLDVATNRIYPDYCNEKHQICCSYHSHDRCRSTDVNLVLKFDDRGRKLHLLLYSLEQPRMVYCFTNAGDELRKRVRLDLLEEADTFTVYDVDLEDYVGEYRCEVHDVFGSVFRSNTVIAYKKDKGNEFSLRVVIENVCDHYDCETRVPYDKFLADFVENSPYKVRTMKIFNFTQQADVLLHLSTPPGVNIIADYDNLSEFVKLLPGYVKILYLRSSEACLPELYRDLTWPLTRNDDCAIPEQFCVQLNGLPVYRSCYGDFLHGAYWSEVFGDCTSVSKPETTELLLSALNGTVCEGVLKNVSGVTKTGNLSLVDLYYVSRILHDVASDVAKTGGIVDGTLEIVDGLLNVDAAKLTQAQSTFNLTDEFLRATENVTLFFDDDGGGVFEKTNVIIHSFKPISSNVCGFVLYRNRSIDDVPCVETFDWLPNLDDVQLACYISQDLLKRNSTDVAVTSTIYLNDKFFPAADSNKTAGIVVNINVRGYETYLPSPIQLLIASASGNVSCAFWDYGSSFQRKKGRWSDTGSQHLGTWKNYSHLQVCSYTHLTHLGMLVLEKALEPADDGVLNVVTGVGCCLSTFGILGIFVTAFWFDKWREKTGSQILIHLSVATLLEIFFLYFSGIKLLSCRIAGVTIQYVIISKFAWMLIYALCQYLRFVRVLGPMPKYFVLKSVIFGWGVALVPVLCVALLDPNSYEDEQFCYPSGLSLYLGIYLPIFVILVINTSIFGKIMWEITGNRMNPSSQTTKLHLRLAVLLFFVLGIPWIFGMMANLVGVYWLKAVLAYVFTVTSSLQGFVMFLFYIILNKETREFWKKLFNRNGKFAFDNVLEKNNSTSTT